MRFNETRHHAAVDLTNLGALPDPLGNLGPGPYGDDPTTRHRECSAVGCAVSTVRMVP